MEETDIVAVVQAVQMEMGLRGLESEAEMQVVFIVMEADLTIIIAKLEEVF